MALKNLEPGAGLEYVLHGGVGGSTTLEELWLYDSNGVGVGGGSLGTIASLCRCMPDGAATRDA